eukprot:jgi/Mesvir1/27745/Mv07435-RA.1
MSGQTALVTGAAGFLGRWLVYKLLERGFHVRLFDIAAEFRATESEQDKAIAKALASDRATYLKGDLRVKADVEKACEGVDVIFHVASPSTECDDPVLFEQVNVQGTKNVIDAAVSKGVRQLIYTSSASVVFDGRRDILQGNETLPYPTKPLDAYTDTKARAEQAVLAANGRKGLLTCALRPSGIFGPGDPIFLPTLVERAKKGKMKFVVGAGTNMMDFTYVENVVHAHLCAQERLVPLGEGQSADDWPGGKAFFITNGEPRRFWAVIGDFLYGLGYERPRIHLPFALILVLSMLVAAVSAAIKPLQKYGVKLPKSDFTPSRVRLATTSRVFSSARAARLLGYRPVTPLEEGMRRTVAASAHLKMTITISASQKSRGGAASSSPVPRMIGSPQLADLLLWRRPVTSGALVGGLVLFYRLFVWTPVPLLANVAWCLCLYLSAHVALTGLSLLVKMASGHPVTVPAVNWANQKVSEDKVKQVVARVARGINDGTATAAQMLKGAKPSETAKIAVLLAVVARVGSLVTLPTLVLAVVLAAFTLPKLYDMHHTAVDDLVAKGLQRVTDVKKTILGAKRS